MITEDYVSFETAKLLKEKGFDVYGDGSFDSSIKVWMEYSPFGKIRDISTTTPSVKGFPAPTLQMAMKWLRKEHNLVITVSIGNENNKGNTDYSNPDRWFYFFDITNEKGVVIDTEYDPLSNEFPTYEEACETGIKYCLENLI